MKDDYSDKSTMKKEGWNWNKSFCLVSLEMRRARFSADDEFSVLADKSTCACEWVNSLRWAVFQIHLDCEMAYSQFTWISNSFQPLCYLADKYDVTFFKHSRTDGLTDPHSCFHADKVPVLCQNVWQPAFRFLHEADGMRSYHCGKLG